MNDTDLRAKLLAHSYLIEVTLGTLLSSHPNHSQLIDQLRFELVAQLRDDHSALQPGFASPDAKEAVVHSATDYLNQMLDRIASQFELPPPTRHNA